MNYPALLGYTAEISFVSAFLQTFVCGVVGYGFARFDFPFKRILFAVVILTIIVPVQTYLSPLYMMFRFFRLPDCPPYWTPSQRGAAPSSWWIPPGPSGCSLCSAWGSARGCSSSSSGQFYRGMAG